MQRRFTDPMPDAVAEARIRAWAVWLELRVLIRRERISIWQVTDERGRPGCGLVGVYLVEDGACILHTRRLSDEDIVHELLHVAHPDWSESQVVEETAHCAALAGTLPADAPPSPSHWRPAANCGACRATLPNPTRHNAQTRPQDERIWTNGV